MKIPVIDTLLCSKCEGCISTCPTVFRYNSVLDVVEVVELEVYPKDTVDEAIRDCPEDCISWEDE